VVLRVVLRKATLSDFVDDGEANAFEHEAIDRLIVRAELWTQGKKSEFFRQVIA
jgi:hypothetical protein